MPLPAVSNEAEASQADQHHRPSRGLRTDICGFLGVGEKDVAVNFNSIKKIMKNDKVYLTMDTTKDALKSAPGFKYDSTKTTLGNTATSV